jgi:hypothetical protein
MSALSRIMSRWLGHLADVLDMQVVALSVFTCTDASVRMGMALRGCSVRSTRKQVDFEVREQPQPGEGHEGSGVGQCAVAGV